MTDSNYTHILAIVDRSGSMSRCYKQMQEALNEFFAGQALVEGKCLVDYVQFDNVYEKVFEDSPVADARAVIHPRNATALLDAIGRGATELGRKLKNLSEVHRPGKVLVVVVTDGHENASREWSADKVRELVRQQEDQYNWEFLFLGANIDAVAVGNDYGFKFDNTLTFDTSNASATMDSVSVYASNYRTVGSAAFSAEDREKAVKKSDKKGSSKS